MAMHLLVALVVVPVTCGIGAGSTAEGLLARVPQHVAFKVHALVAAVVAKATPKRFVTRVDATMTLEVGQVATGIGAEGTLVGLLSCMDSLVPFQVIQMSRGVRTAGTAEGLLTTVCLHVPGQVVRIVRGKGAEATGKAFVTGSLGSPTGTPSSLSSHAAPTHGSSQPTTLTLLQLLSTASTGPRKQQFWQWFGSSPTQALPFTPQLPTVWQEIGTTCWHVKTQVWKKQSIFRSPGHCSLLLCGTGRLGWSWSTAAKATGWAGRSGGPGMGALMPPQVAQAAAGKGAVGTAVGLLASVGAGMSCQVDELGGGVGAAATAERLLPAVCLHVPLQVARVVGHEGAEAA